MKDVMIDGYVTKNIDVRSTNSGQLVTSFSINSPNYNRDTKTTTPQFFDCEYWHNGQHDDKARNIYEGALLLLWGQLAYEAWQDRQGNNRSKVKIKVREIGLIRSPQQQANNYQQLHQSPQVAPAPVQQPAPQQYQQQPQYAPQAAPAAPQMAASVVDASVYDTDITF